MAPLVQPAFTDLEPDLEGGILEIQHEAEMEAAQKKAEGIRAYQDSISDKEAHYTMLKNKLSNEILKARKEVKNLKIVIPHMFEETFNVLNSK